MCIYIRCWITMVTRHCLLLMNQYSMIYCPKQVKVYDIKLFAYLEKIPT